LKIQSAIRNAKAFLKLQQDCGSFDAYLWNFVGGKPKHNQWQSSIDIPSKTKISDMLSDGMKKKVFL
jgi:DNA-3-methyladenine glycosylase I